VASVHGRVLDVRIGTIGSGFQGLVHRFEALDPSREGLMQILSLEAEGELWDPAETWTFVTQFRVKAYY
jgi:ribosomal protein L3